MLDKITKLCAVAIAAGFLVLYATRPAQPQAGRYQWLKGGVLDTATGQVYRAQSVGGTEYWQTFITPAGVAPSPAAIAAAQQKEAADKKAEEIRRANLPPCTEAQKRALKKDSLGTLNAMFSDTADCRLEEDTK